MCISWFEMDLLLLEHGRPCELGVVGDLAVVRDSPAQIQCFTSRSRFFVSGSA